MTVSVCFELDSSDNVATVIYYILLKLMIHPAASLGCLLKTFMFILVCGQRHFFSLRIVDCCLYLYGDNILWFSVNLYSSLILYFDSKIYISYIVFKDDI